MRLKLNIDAELTYKGLRAEVDGMQLRFSTPAWFKGDDRDITIVHQEPHHKTPMNLTGECNIPYSLWLVKLTVQNRYRPWTRRTLYRLHIVKGGDPWYGKALYMDDVPTNQLSAVDQGWCWYELHVYEGLCKNNNRPYGSYVIDLIQYYHPIRNMK